MSEQQESNYSSLSKIEAGFANLLEEDLEFEEEGSGVLPQGIQHQYIATGDVSWRYHRNAKLNALKTNKIDWEIPTTKKQREEAGITRLSELTAHPDHHFCAIRGIILRFEYGSSLVDNSNPTNPSIICHTTKLVEYLEDKDRVTNSKTPLRFPFYQIHKSKDFPHQMSTFLEKPNMKLFGSRPPVGTEEGALFSEFRTCKSCVEAGEHYLASSVEAFRKQNDVPKCSMNGFIVFCVFQLGRYDTTDLLDGGSAKIKWLNIKDANLYTVLNGVKKQLTHPFILRLNGLTKSQHSSIGDGEYDRQLGTLDDFLPTKESIYSLGDYYKYLHDPRAKRYRVLKGGNELAFPVVTEMHLAPLKVEKYQSSHIPVFHPISDVNVISAGANWSSQDWLKVAIAIEKLEIQTAKGEGGDVQLPDLLIKAVSPVSSNNLNRSSSNNSSSGKANGNENAKGSSEYNVFRR
jgi:hypothetical protein